MVKIWVQWVPKKNGVGWNILLGYIFFLACTQIANYCLFTKRIVKKKVARNVSIEMKNLTKEPVAKDVVIVPGLV